MNQIKINQVNFMTSSTNEIPVISDHPHCYKTGLVIHNNLIVDIRYLYKFDNKSSPLLQTRRSMMS